MAAQLEVEASGAEDWRLWDDLMDDSGEATHLIPVILL